MTRIRWTQKHIDDLVAAGKVKKAVCSVLPKKSKKPNKALQTEPKAVHFIKKALQGAGISYETEYYFAKPRMFRFDIAVPEMMLAIEYEGLAYKKTGHTTSEGYTKNCEKYNLAASKGWRLYRYTFKNYRDFESDLKTIINH